MTRLKLWVKISLKILLIVLFRVLNAHSFSLVVPLAGPSGGACSSTYDPKPYRPGTSGWNGRIGKIAFNNGTSAFVKVTLFHPDAPTRPFNSWNIPPKKNAYLGDGNYGMDWGIQIDDSPICIVDSVSDWNSFNGGHIFQTWVERVLNQEPVKTPSGGYIQRETR